MLKSVRLTKSNEKNQAKVYVKAAKRSIVYEAAATAWDNGVPWAESLELSEKAVEKAHGKPKALPKKKAKTK